MCVKRVKFSAPAGLKILALLMVSFNIFISCESPFRAGLGSKVDITPPKIKILSPEPGAFIFGSDWRFTAQAEDDVSVNRVEFAVVADSALAPTQWFPATPSDNPDEPGLWFCVMDTTTALSKNNGDEGDGPVMIRFRVYDDTNKNGVDDQSYYIKNQPPKVELSVPVITVEDLRPAELPEVPTGTNLIGAASDIQGVAPGYPKLRLWRDNEAESDAWYYPDSPTWREEAPGPFVNGRQALQFYWQLVERDPNGTILKDTEGKALRGLEVMDEPYHFRIVAYDLAGHERQFPDPQAYPEGGLFKVIAQTSLPELRVESPLDRLVYAPAQTIKAVSWHESNIKEFKLYVQDPSGNKRRLKWDSLIPHTEPPAPPKKGGRGLAGELFVEAGGTVDEINEDNVVIGAFSFLEDSSYGFTLEAHSTIETVFTASFTLVLDKVPPEVAVTAVDNELYINSALDNPWSYIDPAGNLLPSPQQIEGAPGDFVNGRVGIRTSSIDNNGLHDTDKPRWIIRDQDPSGLPAANPGLQTALEALYLDPASTLVGDPPGSGNRIYWGTLSPLVGSPATAEKHLYVIARDKAGNYGYDSRRLQVNQRTDYPAFVLPGMDRTVNTASKLVLSNGNPSPNVLTSVNIQVELRDDDGIDPGTVAFKVGREGGGLSAVSLGSLNLGAVTNKKAFTFTVTEALLAGALGVGTELPEGTYRFTLDFKDLNGLQGSSGEIYFAKDTAVPYLELTHINDIPKGAPPYWIPGDSSPQTVRFKGTLNEASGVLNLTLFKVESRKPDNSMDASHVFPVDGPLSSAITLPNPGESWHGDWEVDLILPAGSTGRRIISITAVDKYGRTSNFQSFDVNIDPDPPALAFTSATLSAEWFRTGQALQGTADDGTGSGLYKILYWIGPDGTVPAYPASLSAVFPGYGDGTDYTAAGWQDHMPSSSWHANLVAPDTVAPPIHPQAYTEGRKVIYAVAFDRVGHVSRFSGPRSYITKTFTIDNEPPQIEVEDSYALQAPPYAGVEPVPHTSDTVQNIKTYYPGEPFKLEGKLSDTGALARVTVTQQQWNVNGSPDGSPVTVFDRNPVPPAVIPSPLLLSVEAALQNLPLPSQGDGIYTYTITATDGTGKVSEVSTPKVVLDRTGPELRIDPIPNGRIDGLVMNFRGTATDSLSAINRLFYTITSNTTPPWDNGTALDDDYPSHGWTAITAANSWAATHTFPAGAPEGTRYLYLKARDAAHNWSQSLAGLNLSAIAATDPVVKFELDLNPPEMGWQSQTGMSASSPAAPFPPFSSPVPAYLADTRPFDDAVRGSTYYAQGNFAFTFDIYDTNAFVDNPLDILTQVTVKRNNTPLAGAELSAEAQAYTPGQKSRITVTQNGLADGNYLYEIRVTDRAGKDVTGTIRVIKDSVAPALTIDNPTQGLPVGTDAGQLYLSSLTVSGITAETGSGVQEIWYKFVHNNTAAPSETPADINNGHLWYKLSNPGTAWYETLHFDNNTDPATENWREEGTHYLYMRAKDHAGNWSPLSPPAGRQFEVDANPPELSSEGSTNITNSSGGPVTAFPGHFDGTTYYSRGGTGNGGTFDFTFKAQDTNALDSANPYQVTRQRTAPTVGPELPLTAPTVITQTGSSANHKDLKITQTVEASEGDQTTVGQGEYTYRITIKDRAGKFTSGSVKVFVDTAPPSLTIVSPAPGQATSDSASLFVSGSTVETGSGVAHIYYKVANASPHAPITNPDTQIVGTWTELSSPGTTWSENLNFSPALPAEGSYYLYMIAQDKAGNWSTLSPDNNGRHFELDTANPGLKWTAQQTIFGDTALILPQDFDAGTYYTRGTTGNVGGTLSFTFRGTDTNGFPATGAYTVTRQKGGGPVQTLTSGSGLTVSTGTESGSKYVQVVVDQSIASVDSATGITDGLHTYQITVKDKAGKTTGAVFKLMVDVTPPALTVQNPIAGFAMDTGTSLTVSGVAAETGSGMAEIWYKIGTAAPPAEIPGAADFDNAHGWYELSDDAVGTNWHETLIFGGPKIPPVLLEGSHWLYVYGKDKAGNWSTLTPPAGRRFEVDTAPPVLFWTGEAHLMGAPALSATTVFTGDTYYTRGSTGTTGGTFSFTLKGTDTNDLPDGAALTVTRLKKGESTALTLGTALGVPAYGHTSGGTVTATVTQTLGGTDNETTVSNGEYTYTITVKDQANKTITGTIKVIVDTLAPVLTIQNPAPNLLLGTNAPGPVLNSLAVGGIAVETGSGMAEIWYYFVRDPNTGAPTLRSNYADDTTANAAGWYKLQAAGTTWYELLALTGTPKPAALGEGTHYLFMQAKDHAGNWSTLAPDASGVKFNVDAAPPVLFWTGQEHIQGAPALSATTVFPGGTTYYTRGDTGAAGGNFTFTFTGKDTNGFPVTGDYTVTRQKTGDATTEIPLTGTGAITRIVSTGEVKVTVTQTLHATSTDVQNVQNGDYTYTLKVRDKADKEAEAVFRVIVDYTAPGVTVTSPAEAPLYVHPNLGSLSIGGTINNESSADSSGIGEIWYQIKADDTPPAANFPYTNEAAANAALWYKLAAPVTSWSQIVNFGSPGYPPAIGEGSHYLYIMAADRAGNWSTLTPPLGRRFEVDTSPPVLRWSGATGLGDLEGHAPAGFDREFDGSRYYASGNFTISFELSDGNALHPTLSDGPPAAHRIEVTRTLSGTATRMTVSTADTLGQVVVTQTDDRNNTAVIKENFSALGTSGEYLYTITGWDRAGKEVSGTIKVVKDTEGPIVTISTPKAPDPYPESISGTTMTLSGAAADPGNLSPIAEIRYKVTSSLTNSEVSYTDGAGWALIPPGQSWVKAHTISSAEGTSYLYVVARDAAGNWGKPNGLPPSASAPWDGRRFEVDATPPAISLIGSTGVLPVVSTLANTYYVRGNFDIDFEVKDSNALAGTNPYKVTRKIGAAPATDITPSVTAHTTSPAGETYLLKINETAAGGWADGDIVYEITATDVVGKTAGKTLWVVKDSSPPSVEITQFTRLVSTEAPLTLGDNNVNGVIQFVIATSDLNGVSRLKYWILPSATAAPTLWTTPGGRVLGDLPGTPIPRPTRVLWNTTGTDTASAAVVNQSDYKLYIMAIDPAGNETLLTPGTPGNPYGTLHVYQESDKPRIEVSNPPSGAGGGFVRNKDLLLQGLVRDDDGVLAGNNDTVQYQYSTDGSSWNGTWINAPSTGTGNLYQTGFASAAPIDFLNDGSKKIKLKAQDHYANKVGTDQSGSVRIPSGEMELSFVVDSTPPALSITVPLPNQTFRQNYHSSTAPLGFRAAGTLTERYLYSLKVSLDGGSYQPLTVSPDTDQPSTPSPRNWEHTMANDAFNALPQGAHTLTFEALDKAGNLLTQQVVFYIDTQAPEIGFINIAPTEIAAADIGQGADGYNGKLALITTLQEGNAVLRGTFADEYSRVGFAQDAGHGNEYYFEYRVYNQAQLTGTKPLWVKSYLGVDPNKAPGWNIYLTNDGTQTGTGLPDGRYWVDVRVADRAGNDWSTDTLGAALSRGTLENIAFALDRVPPALVITSPPSGGIYTTVNSGDVITLVGEATDSNLKEVRVTFNGTTSTVTTSSLTAGNLSAVLDTSGATKKLTWTYKIPKAAFDAGGLAQGLHTITVTAEDDGGRSAATTWNFTKDTLAPAIEFINIRAVEIPDATAQLGPGNGAYDALAATVTRLEESSAVLRGSFADDFSFIGFTQDAGQYYFEYRIYDRTKAADSTHGGATWQKLPIGSSTPKNLTWQIPLSSLADGIYWLDLRVSDRLGNGPFTPDTTGGALNNQVFALDRNPPEITDISLASGKVYGVQGAGPVFTLTGKSKDANLFKTTVKVGTSGSELELTPTVTSQTSPQLVIHEWTWTLSKADFDALSEGEKDVYFTAYDSAGRSYTYVPAGLTRWVFVKDLTPPQIEFLNLDPASSTNGFQSPAAAIQGVVRDPYGIKTIETKLEKYNVGTSTWEAVSDTSGVPGSTGFTILETGNLGTMKTWSKNIGTGGLNLGEGNYRVTVRAEDQAGPTANLSINDKPSFGIGAFVPGTDEIKFTIDYNPPALEITTGPAFSNGKDSGGTPVGYRLTGTASDGNGMYEVKLQLSRGSTSLGSAVIASHTGDFTNWTWDGLIPYSLLDTNGEGTYTVKVTAKDQSGKETQRTRDFTFDKTPPTAGMIMPEKNLPLNGYTVVRGTTGDNNSVAKVEYQLGKSMNTWTDAHLEPGGTPVANFAGGLYSWSYTFTAANGGVSGPSWANHTEATEVNISGSGSSVVISPQAGTNIWQLPFKIRVTDIAGNQYVDDSYLILDPDGDIPRASIVYPGPQDTVGGEVRVSGVATDDDWIHAVLIRTYKGTKIPANIVRYPVTGHPEDPRRTNEDGWALASLANRGTSVQWAYTLNIYGELNSGNETQQDVIVEVMPIDSKAYATASDLPTQAQLTYFSAHPDENRLGTPAEVAFKIDSTVPTIENLMIERTNDTVAYQSGIRAARTFKISGHVKDDGAISSIKWRSSGLSAGGSGNYENMLAGGLPVTGNPLFTVAMPATVQSATAFVAGRKYMIKELGTTTPAQWRTFIGASDPLFIPTVGYVFTAKVAGGGGSGSGTAYAAEGALATGPGYLDDYHQKFVYSFTITIDSTASFPVDGEAMRNASGIFGLDLQAEDYTSPYPYRVDRNVSIQVDNFYPTGSYRAPRNASTAAYWVEGRAIDVGTNSGPIEGINRVLVYFERGGRRYNPRGVQWSGSGNGTVTANRIKDMALTTPAFVDNFPYPKLDHGNPLEREAVIVDRNEVGSDDDGDGYIELFSDPGGAVKNWGFQFDTTRFADGPLLVHYIIIDDAGNSAHYRDQIYIRNNPPVIGKVTLKTDYNFNHVAGDFAGESVDYAPGDRRDYRNTDFNSRNYRLGFTVDLVNGNGQKRGRVSAVKANASPVNSTVLVEGTVYTIKTVGNTEWTKLGATSNLTGTTFVATGKADALTVDSTPTSGDALSYQVIKSRDLTGFGAGTATSGSVTFGTRSAWTSSFTDDDFGEGVGNKIADSLGWDNQSLYLVKVWDTTTTGGEAEQLSDVVLVGLNLKNRDLEAPAAVVNPFHWKGAVDNSLYEFSRDNGHIELEGGLSAAWNGSSGLKDKDPKVSGKISIRGSVTDNNLIDSIWVRWDNFTFTGAGATDTLNAESFARVALYSDGTSAITGIDRWSSDGWKMTVTPVSLDKDGHKVEWQLDLDTAKRAVNHIAELDQVFKVVARDMTPNTSANNNNQTTAATKTPRYRMDVTPYISGVSTTVRTQGGIKDSNIRSADGRYSVIQGTNDTFITIRGFNLTGNTVRLLSAAQNGSYDPSVAPVGTVLTAGTAVAPYTSLTASNNSAKSGYLAVYVQNGPASGTYVGTMNNINQNDYLASFVKVTAGINASNGYNEENMPNREADRYTTKNITLNDDRYLQFYTVKRTNIVNGQYPKMIMEGNNPVFGYVNSKGAVGNTTHGGSGYQQDAWAQRAEFNSAAASPVAPAYIEFLAYAIAATDQMGMARDESGRYSHMSVYNHERGGLEFFYDRYMELWQSTNGFMAGMPYTGYVGDKTVYRGNTAISLDRIMQEPGMTIDRFWYPKLIAKGNSVTNYATNYLLYLDEGQATKPLVFRAFQIGTQNATRTAPMSPYQAPYTAANDAQRWNGVTGLYQPSPINPQALPQAQWLDKDGRSFLSAYTNANENTQDYSPGSTLFTAGRNVAATGASKFFDMVVTSNNRVVVVYFDEDAARLKLKYSAPSVDGAATTGITFTDNPVILPEYVGMYVSMVVDSEDHLHIAAFDATDSDLKYIYIPSVTGTQFAAVTVDQHGSVGNWTDIKMKPGSATPYIAYYNATETGGRETIKLAYLKKPVAAPADVEPGVDANGYTTGKWEYATVPALDPPQGGSPKFQRVNLGFMTDGRPMLGYLGTNLEFSYRVNE